VLEAVVLEQTGLVQQVQLTLVVAVAEQIMLVMLVLAVQVLLSYVGQALKYSIQIENINGIKK
jgi:hypothetical protein